MKERRGSDLPIAPVALSRPWVKGPTVRLWLLTDIPGRKEMALRSLQRSRVPSFPPAAWAMYEDQVQIAVRRREDVSRDGKRLDWSMP
jgi:hypothetical protein